MPLARFSPAWLIVAGVAGIALAASGLPSPVLASLLLVGLGADADLARRFAAARATDPAGEAFDGRFEAGGPAAVAAGLRTLHAALYGGLLFIAWAALYDASNRLLPGAPSHAALCGDLALCVVLLVVGRRLAR